MKTPKVDGTLLLNEAESAIVGWFERCGQVPVLIYDYKKLVAHFVEEGMDKNEAEEWVSFNIEGVWMGKGTPAIMHRINSFEELVEFCNAHNLDAPK